MVLRFASVVVMLFATMASATENRRSCFSRSETREWIHTEQLAEPFEIFRKIAASLNAEALSARLCRTEVGWVYEITLLDPNGRIVRAIVDAQSGRTRSKGR